MTKQKTKIEKEVRGRKFDLKSLKPYERKAFRFIQEQYPQYDVAKKFTEEIRILDSYLERGKKLGSYMTAKKLITIFPKRIETAAAKGYYMYTRSSSHLKAPKGMVIDSEIYMTLVFLHEMTHAMQDFEGTVLNEVDTTTNEAEYLRINHSDLYVQLITAQPRPKFRRLQTLQFDGGAKRKIMRATWHYATDQWEYHLWDGESIDEETGKPDMERRTEDIVAPRVVRIFAPKKKKQQPEEVSK